MGRAGSTIVKLLIGSLILGILLSMFNVKPQALLRGLGDTALQIFQIVADMFEWAIGYILLGAVVIIPIWLIVVGIRFVRGKNG